MQTYESLKPTTWDCKYPVVFIPKCRRKVLYQGLRRELGAGILGVDGRQEQGCRA